MIQLQSMSRAILVLMTAPLGLIERHPVPLLVFQVPYGFRRQPRVIALMGMILRNSVILVDQIEQDESRPAERMGGHCRLHGAPLPPIVLTAAAAVLAMIR